MRRPRAGLLVAVASLAAGVWAHAQSTPVEIAMRPYIATLRTVSVTVGRETLPFLFDTGGGFTVLTPETARVAGCAPFGRLTGFRSSGERLDLPRCGPVRLALGDVPIEGEVAVLDVMRLLEGAPRIGGILSLQSLEGRAFTLDVHKLPGGRGHGLAARTAVRSPVAARLSRQAGGEAIDLFLEVAAPGGSLWLELDSGNAGPVLLSPHAIAQLGLTTKGEEPQRVTLDVRGVGPIAVEAVTKDLIYDGLLNARFLESMVITVDLASGRAWITKRA
jgi:hypothetical protein